MKIQLPQDLEATLTKAVQDGHYASLDDVLAEAVRLRLRKLHHPSSTEVPLDETRAPILGSIGALAKDADLLDEIVAETHQLRR